MIGASSQHIASLRNGLLLRRIYILLLRKDIYNKSDAAAVFKTLKELYGCPRRDQGETA